MFNLKFKEKQTKFIEYFLSPFILLIIYAILHIYLSMYLDIISGIIWIFAWVLLGSLPLILSIVYILYSLFKDGTLKESFIQNRGNTYKKIIKYSTILSFIFLFIVIFSPIIVIGLDNTFTDNKAEMKEVVDEITKGNFNDKDKTLALLSWFDKGEGKEENFASIYHRERQKDNEILLNFANSWYIFSKAPHFCCRGDEDMWVFSSKCGRCGEIGILFNTMGYYSGLEVRKVVCKGEDHVWNEILIDDDFIVVDPTAINLPSNNGYNLPRRFMEDKVKGDLIREGLMEDEGNVSYVYAIYPDAPDDRVDITYRYTNLTNITVLTLDTDEQPIEGITVKLYSHNRLQQRDTELKMLTNESGQCTFTIGGGDYTFKAEKGSYYGEKRDSYTENELHHNITVVLE